MDPFEITRLSGLMLTNDYRKGGEFYNGPPVKTTHE